jgi:hypothetical protein
LAPTVEEMIKILYVVSRAESDAAMLRYASVEKITLV